MASERAEQVAHEVIKNLRNPSKSKGDILRGFGYAESVALHPNIVTKTKSYQKVVTPFFKRLEKMRDNIITEMEKKDISKEEFETLAKVLKDTVHDIQLLSGGATEHIAVRPIYNGQSTK